jgi:hypothetical protein
MSLISVLSVAATGLLLSFADAVPFSASIQAPIDSTGVTPWQKHMLDAGYPENQMVCEMVARRDQHTWINSRADDFYWSFMEDNNYNMGMRQIWTYQRASGDMADIVTDDWVQRMNINATAGSGFTPSDIDCTMLHSESCQPPGTGDCERYNPAACTKLPLS